MESSKPHDRRFVFSFDSLDTDPSVSFPVGGRRGTRMRSLHGTDEVGKYYHGKDDADEEV